MQRHRYFILNKPYDMVSQFISSDAVRLLGDVDFNFPEGTHAIGRLDKNSEGLLLLTTNKKITKLLFHGVIPHARKYLVQVTNKVSDEAIHQLASGIAISAPLGEQFITTPCMVQRVERPASIQDLTTVLLHKNVTSTWLTITLTEGKFHQVRKMIAAIRHKCLRLIRISIEDIALEDLQPGEVKEVSEQYFFEKLKL
jgi:23S rRNA pseudouridine2457 synthase